jgi:hypothetical protein
MRCSKYSLVKSTSAAPRSCVSRCPLGCMSTGCSRHACTLVAACPPRHYVARGHSMSVSSVLMGQQDAIIMLLQVGSSRVGFYPTNIFFVWQAPSDWCPRHVCRHSHRALPKVEPRKRCCMRGWSNGARVARAATSQHEGRRAGAGCSLSRALGYDAVIALVQGMTMLAMHLPSEGWVIEEAARRGRDPETPNQSDSSSRISSWRDCHAIARQQHIACEVRNAPCATHTCDDGGSRAARGRLSLTPLARSVASSVSCELRFVYCKSSRYQRKFQVP